MLIVGVDEVGRGPLAGPVAVGVCAVPQEFSLASWGKIRDSKKLSPKKRQEWLLRMESEPSVRLSVAFVEAHEIDQGGIVPAIRRAVTEALVEAGAAYDDMLLLDGGLQAPDAYHRQTSIIRGDETEPVIALASIVAKVMRDRHMEALAAQYPGYGFETHKGYGTKMHRKRILALGPCPEHRLSFLRNILLPSHESRGGCE